MGKLMGVVLALLVPAFAGAAGPHLQASMVVTGTLVVDAEGGVQAYALYQPEALPPGVVQLVEQAIHGWRFQPVVENGTAVPARAGMAVRVVADMADADHVTVHIAGAQFGCADYQSRDALPDACPVERRLQYASRRTPRYPGVALKDNVSGVVYLAVEIGADGRVLHADARRVNLYQRVPRANIYQNAFAASAKAAAMAWKFTPPAAGPDAGRNSWTVVVPVNFSINGGFPVDRGYGHWVAYYPGPVREIPWAGEEGAADAATGGSDAVAGDGMFLRDARFVLVSGAGSHDERS